jgi:iron complex outermembrane receptor protein
VLAPRNTGNAAIEYDIGAWAFGRLSARADVTHSDGFDFNPFLTRYTHADGRTLYNARMTLADVPALGGNLRFSLWGKNLSNEKYRVNGIDFGVDGGSLGYAVAVFGPLRSYGLDIFYEYN